VKLKLAFPILVVASVLLLSSGNKASATSASAVTELNSVTTGIDGFVNGQMQIWGGLMTFIGGACAFAKVRSV
jgi:hypothetical protein